MLQLTGTAFIWNCSVWHVLIGGATEFVT